MFLIRDGVSSALDFDLMMEGKDISEAPKDYFPCVENVR
jgi:hypothetical protein